MTLFLTNGNFALTEHTLRLRLPHDVLLLINEELFLNEFPKAFLF